MRMHSGGLYIVYVFPLLLHPGTTGLSPKRATILFLKGLSFSLNILFPSSEFTPCVNDKLFDCTVTLIHPPSFCIF